MDMGKRLKTRDTRPKRNHFNVNNTKLSILPLGRQESESLPEVNIYYGCIILPILRNVKHKFAIFFRYAKV
jgi:hypothetical protein